jgi:hypothetical protein
VVLGRPVAVDAERLGQFRDAISARIISASLEPPW